MTLDESGCYPTEANFERPTFAGSTVLHALAGRNLMIDDQ